MSALLTFGVLVLVATTTMVGDRRSRSAGGRDLPWWQGVLYDITGPLQKLVAAPVDGIIGVWDDYIDLLGVRAENARLRARLAESEEANLQYREALVASGHLARIAEMRGDLEIPLLPSEVVGLDVSPWFRSVLVDRGRNHGVVPGHPVITPTGVVGLVTATSANAAKTMLVLDRQSSIDALDQRSRARGIVRGTGTAEIEFEFVARGADVEVGDIILTSGMGGVYPKALRIGTVAEIHPAEGSLLQTAVLEPAVDFGQLEQVFVMLRRGQTMELLYRPNAPVPIEAAGAGRPGS